MGKETEMLHIVYDLRVLPATFDFPYFMAVAEARRRLEQRAEQFTLWIVTGKTLRPQGWDWVSEMNREDIKCHIQSRLVRVIIPLTRLFPSISHLNVVDESCIRNLNFMIFHPLDYRYQSPELGIYHKGWYCLDYADKLDMRCLKNTPDSLEYARKYLETHFDVSRLVVITLRNNVVSHDQTRNSRSTVIREIRDTLLRLGFEIAFIPDTSLCGERDFIGDRQRCLILPAFDAGIRSAIYEIVRFSIFEPTGPLVLAQLNAKARFIAYGIGWSEKFNEDYQVSKGYRRDTNFIAPQCSHQTYLWGTLDSELLERWIDSNGS